jgi:histidinol-phosphate/aromatic aminotransferase/cobyric acid decarboxylase-like protein
VTNFLFVPLDDARDVEHALLRRGLLVREYENGIRITVRDVRDDDRLVDELAAILARKPG